MKTKLNWIDKPMTFCKYAIVDNYFLFYATKPFDKYTIGQNVSIGASNKIVSLVRDETFFLMSELHEMHKERYWEITKEEVNLLLLKRLG